MIPRTTCLVGALLAWTLPASAATIVTSLASFNAGAGGAVTSSANPGSYDLTQLFLPTTSAILLGDNQVLSLSTPAQVTAGQNGFPYNFADGFGGEIFVPQDANGNQVSQVTIALGSVSALGFEVAPFSNAAAAPNFGVRGGPYSVTVTLSTGLSRTVLLPGGDANAGTTQSQFFGLVGGGATSVTISTSDPMGFGFGNFVDVPEPATAAVLLVGLAGLAQQRRRAGRA